jgi:hypothetical protein
MAFWGMSRAWGFVAILVVVVVGCGEKKQDKPVDRAPIVREEDMGQAFKPDIDIPTPQVQDETVVDPSASARVDNEPDPKPECVDESSLVSFDPGKLRGCFDTNGDDQADRCVTWRRDGKVAAIDSVFQVEDTDAPEEVEPPVSQRSDSENNDEERITFDYNTVEVCPYDRTCVKFMPKLGDNEVQGVFTDPDYKRAVLLIRDGDGKGIVEIWDLATGRVRARMPMKRLVDDETYEFSAQLGSGVVVALASDTNGKTLGTIFGVDGGFRGEVAQGSRNLDIDKMFNHAGVLGVVAVEDDKPYVLYLHSLATGGTMGKFTIKRDDTAGDPSFHTLKNGFVGVTQWGAEQVRIDMIDLRSKTNRVLFVPSC